MNQDFRDLLSILNDEAVRYLIVGGYSGIRYTEPRYTKDLDIWVGANAENAERVFRALRRFGAPLIDLTPNDFAQEGFFYTMGLAPERVDILFDMTNLDFDECWERRVESDIGDIATHFISADDLIINKEAVARHQDLADVEKLRIGQERAAKKD